MKQTASNFCKDKYKHFFTVKKSSQKCSLTWKKILFSANYDHYQHENIGTRTCQIMISKLRRTTWTPVSGWAGVPSIKTSKNPPCHILRMWPKFSFFDTTKIKIKLKPRGDKWHQKSTNVITSKLLTLPRWGHHGQGDGGHRHGCPRVEGGGGLVAVSQTPPCLYTLTRIWSGWWAVICKIQTPSFQSSKKMFYV